MSSALYERGEQESTTSQENNNKKNNFGGFEDTKTSLLISSKNTVRIFVCLEDKTYD